MSMMLSADDTTRDSTPAKVVLIVLVIAGIIYGLGYARAVMHRANRDYKTTKAAVPVLRRGFWSAWWAAVKVGFFVLVAVGILFLWMVKGTDDGADATPAPSPSVSRTHR